VGTDAAKDFTKEQKEAIKNAVFDAQFDLSSPIRATANVVDKSGQASGAAHLVARAATAGVIAENGAAGQEAGLLGKAIQAIPGAENVAGTVLKYAPMVGEAAPYVAGAGFALAGAYQMADGNVAEGANTTLKGALSVAATVGGAAICGGPETPVGIACGAAAGLYVDHAYETLQENGVANGLGKLAREPGEVAKSLGRTYMKGLEIQGEMIAAGYPQMIQ
jgi:hypothetical protein